ncbi:hypothetical protein EW026_g4062 [Hermanssonia centrifuga]|uniref:Protein kinase domain-containing protein n=1 Tax=Hermanssonia centrifuga TaxID=98765 RepID=A0A4S4KIC7_9APHY|nr:hypothetical protein EW026_g4062 [Hermanssonia centrifuga]
MSISTDTIDDLDVHRGTPPSLLLTPDHHSHLPAEDPFMVKGRVYSPRFPAEHLLNHFFVRSYQLGDELGAGGYGFVMTATHRTGGYEVAVKFIIKDKVPDHAWWEDDMLGRVPTEVMVMSLISHDNIVKCLDIFEDDRYFYLVVEAVHYLDSQGITHCDIKDENLVVDSDFKVKLIDFGSAVVADPFISRPYYTLFFGTTAYASSEILRKQPYQAAPAEIWTLGVLLSYLLTGHSPFPSEQDAIDGRVVMRERGGAGRLSRAALALMGRCLERDPERRADIAEVRGHRWLQGALDRENLQM